MRSKQEVTAIWVKLFPRFAGSSTTLQGRVKEMMVHSILMGLIPPDAKIPPSRSLAESLGISRNTVSLALQVLVDKGFLRSVERSGLFVNREILLAQAEKSAQPETQDESLHWPDRIKTQLHKQRNIIKPANWQDLRYPFVYGQFDPNLMPLKDWRACAHQSLFVPAVKKWSQDHIDRDYSLLIDQIQHRLLPARGIIARHDEILVTAGAQMACYLLANTLVDRKTAIGIEEPGYPDARNNFKLRSDTIIPLPIDDEGLIASRALGQCDYAYTTPSHQCPTTVTMSMQRRREVLELAYRKDVVLIEDDHESELNFSSQPLPALKSLDTHGRVIYLGSLSKTLAHGLRIGYIVASTDVIRELRALRRLIMRHPPSNNAHIASLFIAQGHHDAFIRKLNLTYSERRQVLVEAFARYLPDCQIKAAQGGSGAWVRGPTRLNSTILAEKCLERGILIEPSDVFFDLPSITATTATTAKNHFRLGYSAIATPMITEGVRELSRVMEAWF